MRCYLIGAALLCLTFVLRELDVDELAVPNWVILAGSGTGRNIILGGCWIAFGVFIFKSFSELKGIFKHIICSRSGVLFIAAGVLLLGGDFFDRSVEADCAQLVEEILETLGYASLFIAGIVSRFIMQEEIV